MGCSPACPAWPAWLGCSTLLLSQGITSVLISENYTNPSILLTNWTLIITYCVNGKVLHMICIVIRHMWWIFYHCSSLVSRLPCPLLQTERECRWIATRDWQGEKRRNELLNMYDELCCFSPSWVFIFPPPLQNTKHVPSYTCTTCLKTRPGRHSCHQPRKTQSSWEQTLGAGWRLIWSIWPGSGWRTQVRISESASRFRLRTQDLS